MNVAPSLQQQESPSVAISTKRMVRAYLQEAKYETVRMLRTPSFMIPSIVLPLMLYLLFAVALFGEAMRKDPKAGIFMFLGFSVMGAITPGIFGFGITVALERDQGLLTYKRALPVPFTSYLLAKALMAMIMVGIVMITMIVAVFVSHLPITLSQYLSLSAILVLGSLPFCSLGLFVGARVAGKAAPGIANLVYLPMIYLSGILIPLPKSLLTLASISPAYHLDQLALGVAGIPSQGSAVVHIAYLCLLTALFFATSARRLSKIG